MAEHYNLYYLFLEDKRTHPIPEERNRRIRENVLSFYRKIKPPWLGVRRKSDTQAAPAEDTQRRQ